MNNQQNCEYYIYILYTIKYSREHDDQAILPSNKMKQPKVRNSTKKKKLQNENWDFEVKVLTPENADTSNGIGKQQRYGVWARQVVIKPDQKIGI